MSQVSIQKKSTHKELAEITEQLSAIQKMNVSQLRAVYAEIFEEPTRSRNKDFLRKKIAWRIQELADGGLSERAKEQIEKLAVDAPARWRRPRGTPKVIPFSAKAEPERDPRLPNVGEVISRMYKDQEHEVTVLDVGFNYCGKDYPSLSKIARQITGTNWNGFLFFGLQKRSKQPTDSSLEQVQAERNDK